MGKVGPTTTPFLGAMDDKILARRKVMEREQRGVKHQKSVDEGRVKVRWK